MIYKNILRRNICKSCNKRDHCFLYWGKIERYPVDDQRFMIYLMPKALTYNFENRQWHGTEGKFQDAFAEYYDTNGLRVPSNQKAYLSQEAQRESDLTYIQNTFKALLTAASEAAKEKDPMLSIMFDGIGLVLATDYLEAVHKLMSIFSTVGKMQNNGNCGYYE